MSTTVAVSVLFQDVDGQRIITTPGQLIRPGLAITPLPDADGHPTDLYTFTHVPSGMAIPAHGLDNGLCEICIHFAGINRQLTRLDWTRTVEQLRADRRVYNVYVDLLRAAWLCDRPCTFVPAEQP